MPTDPREPAATRARRDATRAAEIRAVRALADRATGPLIVLGDFNDVPGSSTHAQLAGRYQDACAQAGPTWPDTWPVLRLDQVWLSAGWHVASCQVAAGGASDHRAVVTVLSRSGAGGPSGPP
jgi:endonuclease/exonuclease/phosphatase (EEP) superfamily protein YafD